MTTARDHPGVVGVDGKIYVFGGSNASGALDSVEIYDPATDTWTSGPSMPGAKSTPSAVAGGGLIYVLGGNELVYCFDPSQGTWSTKAPVPVSFSGPAAVAVVEGKIYLARDEQWMYCYDPGANNWTAKTPVSVVRSIASFAVLNGKLYAIGGGEPGHEPSEIDRIDVYDPASDSWTIAGAASLGTRRTHLGSPMPVVNGKIYVIGGWNGYSAQTSVEEYDPTTNNWRYVAVMPMARYAIGYGVLSNKVYAIGGNYGGAGGHWQSRNDEFSVPPQDSEVQLTAFARGAMDPALKQMADGSIWLIGHYQEDWQPFYTISYDGGQTWSAPALLWDNWCYDLDLAQDSYGRIWAAWAATVPDPYDPVYRTTTDGGQTWSDATKLSVPPDHDTVMSVVPTLANETCLCWEGGCIASTDGGQTWGSVRTMPHFGWNNATFSRTSDGRLWVVTVVGGEQVQLQWSTDNGQTWSSPLTVASVEPAPPSPREPIRPVARLLEDSGGQLWLAWYAYSSSTESSQVWFTKSTDAGATWSSPTQTTTDPSFHGSYFSNINLAEVNGYIWVVYASDKSGAWQVYRQIVEVADLSGAVFDAATNDPLSGVQIKISGPSQGITTTNEYGQYAFDDLPAGEYWFEASKNDYDTVGTLVNVMDDTVYNPLMHPALSREDLAGHYAPAWYQDVDSEDIDADYITNFNFDGNWDGDDNWQNQNDDIDRLKAHIYYSIVETESHWFILYADFHPRDWGGIHWAESWHKCTEEDIEWFACDDICHENDMEGVLVAVKKDGSDYGDFHLMETVSHLGFEQYSNDENITPGWNLSGIDGGVQFYEDSHPMVYVEPLGHGVTASTTDFTDGNGVIYVNEVGYVEIPPTTLGVSETITVTYALTSTKGTLWERRHDYMIDMDGERTYKSWGKFAEDEVCPPLVGARPPWGWTAAFNPLIRYGDFFWDPAYTVDVQLNGLGVFSHTYVYNPYCSTEVVVSSDQGGSLVSNDGSAQVRMAPGITTASIRVVHTRNCIGGPDIVSSLANAPVKRASLSQLSPTAISDLESIGQNLSLSATFLETGLPVTDLQKPYEMTFRYTDDDVENIFEDSLALYWWDGDEWVAEPTSAVDEANNTVAATPGHLGIFVVMGTPKTTIYLPLVLRNYQ
ncbi:MAG: kelch repeat-containing protein [Chloroflexota bacterium]|nr:kelch repeat-containing protein [Chloroflexota bacterium]